MTKTLIAGALALALTACGVGEEHGADHTDEHAGMDHSEHMAAMDSADLTPAQQAYADVNARMHEGMSDISADADVAFMQGMLAHHIGAVEMSQVALEYGEDDQARDLAQRIIDAQEAEIAEMEAWLAKRSTDTDEPAEQ